MMRKLILLLALVALPSGAETKKPTSFYDLSARSLAGKPVALKIYRGKVALVVNVASECGFTPQYRGLQALHEKYGPRGLVVLGFPSNDFGGQEPGSAAQIQQFCSSKFHVTFPMFQKVQVRGGPGQSPVYRFLSQKGDIPGWNFGKYLVDRKGKPIGFYGSMVTPESPELLQAIEAALK